MAVAATTKTKGKTSVETGEKEIVNVDPQLEAVIQKWGEGVETAGSYWLNVAVQLANMKGVEEEPKRAQLKKALNEHRGMEGGSLNVEASKLLAVSRNPKLKQLMKDYQARRITVKEIRDMGDGTKPESKGEDKGSEKILKLKLVNAIKYAIEKREVDVGEEDKDDFLNTVGEYFDEVTDKLQKADQKRFDKDETPLYFEITKKTKDRKKGKKGKTVVEQTDEDNGDEEDQEEAA
jgi:hypothetical protein